MSWPFLPARLQAAGGREIAQPAVKESSPSFGSIMVPPSGHSAAGDHIEIAAHLIHLQNPLEVDGPNAWRTLWSIQKVGTGCVHRLKERRSSAGRAGACTAGPARRETAVAIPRTSFSRTTCIRPPPGRGADQDDPLRAERIRRREEDKRGVDARKCSKARRRPGLRSPAHRMVDPGHGDAVPVHTGVLDDIVPGDGAVGSF